MLQVMGKLQKVSAVALFCAMFAGAAMAAAAVGSSPPDAVYAVRLAGLDAGGQVVSHRVEVLAESPAEAEAAARAALLALGRPEPAEQDASAQWLPWSWQWGASEIPVPVAYNPTGAPLSVGPSIIIAGLQAWSDVPASSFRFRYAGITNNVASILSFGPDGENVISWASLPCDRGCVLGITSKEAAHEVDMLLNSNPEAAEQLGVGATVDWRTVILHELGHMAGLEHSCPVPFGPCTQAEADAVMFYQYRGTLRKLAPDDVAGLAALYPLTASPSPQPAPGGPAPTPTPFPELVVIVERGWNLVVLPFGPVADVTDILACARAAYDYHQGEWRAWIRGLVPALQGFSQFEPGRAYWLLADSPCAHVFP